MIRQNESQPGSHPWIKWVLIGGAVFLVLGGAKVLNDVGNKVDSVLNGVRGKKRNK